MSKATGDANTRKGMHDRKVAFVGPGTGAMLLCLVLILGWQMLHQPKVRIERKVEVSGERPAARLPAVSDLLDWKTSILLTEQQFRKLDSLHDQQTKELIPIEAQAREIMSHVQQAADGNSRRPLSSSDLQLMAKQLSIPSKRKREIERQFSESAWSCLSANQKENALKLWRISRNNKAIRKEAGKN